MAIKAIVILLLPIFQLLVTQAYLQNQGQIYREQNYQAQYNQGQHDQRQYNQRQMYQGQYSQGQNNFGQYNQGQNYQRQDNQGQYSQGQNNFGQYNQGQYNQGQNNLGQNNFGQNNQRQNYQRQDNRGQYNQGQDNQGQYNQRQKYQGQNNFGQYNQGQNYQRQDNQGQYNQVQNYQRQDNQGQYKHGQKYQGQNNLGQYNQGQNNLGQNNFGQNNFGQYNQRQNYLGQRQYDSNPQDVQIASSFGDFGLDTQMPIRDSQIEAIDISQRAPAAPVATTHPAANYMDRFSSKLFQKIAPASPQCNVVYSPVSIHALMALIYGASVGKTFQELQKAGEFYNRSAVATDFKDLINYKKGLGEAELTIATKVYYNRLLGGVNPSFAPFAQDYFHADIEPLNMDQPMDSANRINAWVSDSTHGKIQNLISPSELDSRTQALLVNAIYFKGHWENAFGSRDTRPYQFQHSDGTSSSVAMMYNRDTYGLADIPELDATLLELAYKNSGTSMMILLPKQSNGLANLERQLARPELDLDKIAARVRPQTVVVHLPKFRVEFEQDMTVPLQQLGVQQMFTSQSQINIMLKKRDEKVRVEKILQKAFIEVCEAGTEAAAASYAKIVPMSMPEKTPEFTADHPFVFAIRTASSVLFMGHVEYPTLMAPGTDKYNEDR